MEEYSWLVIMVLPTARVWVRLVPAHCILCVNPLSCRMTTVGNADSGQLEARRQAATQAMPDTIATTFDWEEHATQIDRAWITYQTPCSACR